MYVQREVSMRGEVIRKVQKRAGVFIVFFVFFLQNSPTSRDTAVETRQERRPVSNLRDNRCSFARFVLHGRRTPDKARRETGEFRLRCFAVCAAAAILESHENAQMVELVGL